MPFDKHTVESPDGDQANYTDRLFVAQQYGLAAGAQAGAGFTQSVTVNWASQLPPNYQVHVELDTAVTNVTGLAEIYVSSKQSTSFVVNFIPGSASINLPILTFNVMVVG